MLPTYRTTTRVVAGEVTVAVPEWLPEGKTVNVIVMPGDPEPAGVGGGILQFLESLPRPQRSAGYWEEREREFQEGRDSWDR